MLLPDLLEAIGVATADALSQGESGDVAACVQEGLAGFDDLISGDVGWAHVGGTPEVSDGPA
ncbi:hypothetical protein D3C80_2202540 [compost metagenome]